LHEQGLSLNGLFWNTKSAEKNRTKSRLRSKVEHVFGVLKLKFGFVKVRYRGLARNANRLFAAFALVNLFLVRRKLLSSAA
jgi:IS5 family transposase